MEKRQVEWYTRQIKGLMLIVKDAPSDTDRFIAREYILEKLGRVLSGSGIGFHPVIERRLDATTG